MLKKGYASYDSIKQVMEEQFKTMVLTNPEKVPTPEEIEVVKKLADPDDTRKVTCENFTKFIKNGIKKLKMLEKFKPN